MVDGGWSSWFVVVVEDVRRCPPLILEIMFFPPSLFPLLFYSTCMVVPLFPLSPLSQHSTFTTFNLISTQHQATIIKN
jgi:hypothetical protein